MKKQLTIFLLLALQVAVWAAPGTPPPPPGGAPPGFPIPGIALAVVAALAYGAYKHYTNPKK